MAVQVGGWGGDGGVNPWTFTLDANSKITRITVSSDSYCVYSITFTYKDKDRVEHSETHGAKGGKEETLTLADGEYICRFSGTYGFHGECIVITSLSFQGSKNSCGTYGTPRGTDFSLPLAEGKFAGFFGNYGVFFDSIGAVLSP